MTRTGFFNSLLIGLGIFFLFQTYIVYQLNIINSLMARGFQILDDIIILFLFIFIIFKNLLQRKFNKTPIDFPLIVTILIGITSAFLYNPNILAISLGFFLFLKGILVFYIVSNIKINEILVKKIVKIFAIIGLIIILFAVLEIILPGFPIFMKRSHIGKLTIETRYFISLVGSINIFSWIMGFLTLFSVAYYFVFRKKKYLFFSIIFFLGNLISFTRKTLVSSIIGIIIGSLYLVLNRQKRYKSIIKVMFLFAIFILIFIPYIFPLFEKMWQIYFITNPYSVARTGLYIVSFKIAIDFFPLGVGFGNFGGAASKIFYSPVYYQYGLDSIRGLREIDIASGGSVFMMDTFWPHIIGELGIIGTLFYLIIIFKLIRICSKGFKKLPSLYLKAFSLGTLMILIASLIEAVAEITFEKPPIAYFIFGACGIVFSLLKKYNYKKISV